MTQYLTLINPKEPETTLNFCWGEDCGVWIIHPTPKSKSVAHMVVHEVQEKTRHNRKKMAKFIHWELILNKYIKMYDLIRDDSYGHTSN